MRRAPSIAMAGEFQGVSAARQGSELHHRPGGRETDAKGLIVKNIAGRLERTACDGMRKQGPFVQECHRLLHLNSAFL